MIPSIGQVDVLAHHLYDRSWLLFFRSSFGTWKIPVGHTTTDRVDQAISVGFSHIGKTLTLVIDIQNSPNAVFSIFFDTLGNDKKKTPHRSIGMRPKRVWPFETADSDVMISLSLQNMVDWMGWISKLLFKIV